MMGIRYFVVVMNVLILTISYITRANEMTDVNKSNASSTEGTLLPANTSIMVRWLPSSEERVYCSELIYGGIGTTNGLSTLGYQSSTLYARLLLYCVVLFVYMVLVAIIHPLITSSPEDHPFISEDEQQRIIESTTLKVPSLSLLTSFAVTTLINYAYWTFLMNSPRCISGVTDLAITSTGFYASLPNLCVYVTVFLFMFVKLELQINKISSLTTRRNMWITIAVDGQDIFFLMLPIWKPDILVLFGIVVIMVSTHVAIGMLANQMDLSPNFVGILMGLTMIVGSISGVVVSYL